MTCGVDLVPTIQGCGFKIQEDQNLITVQSALLASSRQSSLLQQGISERIFYVDLVYKFKRIVA